ncbi:hypothetical protein BH11PLA1_BH11PLA1_09090 [soil metagenome]
MLLTLHAGALRSRLQGFGTTAAARMKLTDIPALARGELGVTGMILSSDLLAGADRPMLQRVLEAADKAGCPILVLMESTMHALGSSDIGVVERSTERCLRVAQAAHWLGCSAFSLPLSGADDEETLQNMAANLKPISRRAEKLDLNLCIAPQPGLTSTPERVAEVLKKIGGFRVGTLPDFGAAAAADPVQYLRRLVPYASAVLVPASEYGLDPAAAKAPEEPAAAAKKSRPSTKSKGDVRDDPKPEVKTTAKPRLTKPKKSTRAEVDEAVKKMGSHTAAPRGGAGSGDYDLVKFAQVLEAVGYEGPITLDYRGTGDPLPALIRARDIVIKTLSAPAAADDSGLSALLAAVEGDVDELDEPEEDGAKLDE